MTDIHDQTSIDFDHARRRVERAVGVANLIVGLALTVGALAFAFTWRFGFGGYGALRAFYLPTAWAFGALELAAGASMLGRRAVRWILELLPLAVPVVAYQYFILHFIFHRF
ncbi:MAG: hypothetical protein ACHQWU_02170 [Gemmatimonadales bacterium]